MTASITEERRRVLHRRVRFIVGFTISYNVIEAAVALWAGTLASSAALIGFGLDSIVEVLSALAVAWQFTRKDPERWEKVNTESFGEYGDFAGYQSSFLRLFGFGLDGVDYGADTDTAVKVPSIS